MTHACAAGVECDEHKMKALCVNVQALHTAAAALHRAQQIGPHPNDPDHAYGYIGGAANPARGVSLRTIDPHHYDIVNVASGAVIEQIEESKAFWEIYDGAVYMFQGRPFLCRKVDISARRAEVAPADVRYYTTTIDYCDIHVVGGRVAYTQPLLRQCPATSAICNEAAVTLRFVGFVRIWRGSGTTFDAVRLFLPDVQFTTQAAYVRCDHHLPFSRGSATTHTAFVTIVVAVCVLRLRWLLQRSGCRPLLLHKV